MEAILLSQLVKGFASPANDCYITDVTTDSRSRGKGSLFLAIKGERVNGQNFAPEGTEPRCGICYHRRFNCRCACRKTAGCCKCS